MSSDSVDFGEPSHLARVQRRLVRGWEGLLYADGELRLMIAAVSGVRLAAAQLYGR